MYTYCFRYLSIHDRFSIWYNSSKICIVLHISICYWRQQQKLPFLVYVTQHSHKEKKSTPNIFYPRWEMNPPPSLNSTTTIIHFIVPQSFKRLVPAVLAVSTQKKTKIPVLSLPKVGKTYPHLFSPPSNLLSYLLCQASHFF